MDEAVRLTLQNAAIFAVGIPVVLYVFFWVWSKVTG